MITVKMRITYSKFLATLVGVAGVWLSHTHSDSVYFTSAVAVVALVVAGQNAGQTYSQVQNCKNKEV